MAWQVQGRQQHGWFGHGVGDHPSDAEVHETAAQLAYSALGDLPAADRGVYEDWLGHGGTAQVAAVLPGWVAGSDLPGPQFHATVFGPDGSPTLAAHAQEVGLALADAPAEAAVAAAGRRFAALVTAARPGSMARAMAGAVAQAATPAARSLVQQAAARRPAAAGHGGPAHANHPAGHAAHAAAGHPPAKKMTAAERQHLRDVDDLARVIHNEARGNGRTAMAAVGWTLRNRMLRNGVKEVQQAWRGYNHGPMQLTRQKDRAAYSVAQEVAKGILNGTIQDPTGGATHYYSPQSMPKENDDPAGTDAGGGLETVEGVTDRHGQPARNYRPGYSLTFSPKSVPGIADRDYKFFRQLDGASSVH